MKHGWRVKIGSLFIMVAAVSLLMASARGAPKGAVCGDPVVWAFVADVAAEFPDCKSLPSPESLRDKACHLVELAQLESGCFPQETPVRSSGVGTLPEERTVRGFVAANFHPCRSLDRAQRYNGSAPRMRLANETPRLAIECQGSDQTCARSNECRRNGRCTGHPRSGHAFTSCRVGSDADCAQTERCIKEQQGCVSGFYECTDSCENSELEGLDLPLRKTFASSRYCMPFAGEEDCAKTAACAKYGLCHNYDGFCIAQTDADCRQSEACAEVGACVVVDGNCSARLDVDVRKSRVCKAGKKDPENALCQVLSPDWGRVRLGSAVEARAKARAECEQSQILVDGSCELPAGYDCKSSKACKEEGKCHRYIEQNCDASGHCSDKFTVCVRSDAYCRAQPECAAQGRCAHEPRRLLDTSSKCYELLSTWGMKKPRAHKRYVAPICADYFYGQCVLSNAGCAATEGCAKSGMCSADSPSMYCRPTIAAHCEQSQDCKDHGQCGLYPNSTYQICAATSAEHCEASTACKESGACTLSAGGVCEPAAPDL